VADAIDLYQRAVDAGFATKLTYYSLGLTLALHGRLNEAVPMFEHALELDPRFAIAHRQVATTLVKLNRYSEGIEHYEKALELDPDNENAKTNLGRAMRMRDDYRSRQRAAAGGLGKG
jgi:tetratricopeptide (TPR) repeat protein